MSPGTGVVGEISGEASAALTVGQHLNRREARLIDAPPEHLLRALGPVPQERVARERWQRDARRLEALRPHSNGKHQPAAAHATLPPNESATRAGPSPPRTPLQRPDGPTIGR
jgi:hypothetical protein